MKLPLIILVLTLTVSAFSQKTYKGTISVSPDMFISNKKYQSLNYYGGTIEALGNIKNTSLGLGLNLLNHNKNGGRTMAVGYITVRQSFPINKFIPYAFASIGYGRVNTNFGIVPFKENGVYYHGGAGIRYKALPFIEPFISARYSSYDNGRIISVDQYGNREKIVAWRINGIAVSAGVAFNLL